MRVVGWCWCCWCCWCWVVVGCCCCSVLSHACRRELGRRDGRVYLQVNKAREQQQQRASSLFACDRPKPGQLVAAAAATGDDGQACGRESCTDAAANNRYRYSCLGTTGT